ncbi:MED7-domain-containing protein [Basidiobolus meristosporus CBS 931.73]|uniref:Mediator of RNA polymerase II transcription subunit 7 n=1 Tax=Basidiobolus meristosporus CBS 931.73 TaxID=1314790 RepID=A0A1Y1XV01_9FUNG|nr:MED7-domain-containing protein [Basidiobolus meristosporus CBS 931.73]|eukprot:ORX89543.1 MED7-domain-containing protein [Basidiobolus meristosporus CBS 931.73]
MATQPQLGAAYPAPPDYYKRFTDENLEKFRTWKESDNKSNPTAPTHADKEFEFLEPPKPITEGEYWMFGKRWLIEDVLPSLEEQNVQQLYPKESIDRIKELKKLNFSLVFSFLELVETLIRNPTQFTMNIDHIRLILINMHHIINEYRPHQAKETLTLILQEQVQKRKNDSQLLSNTCDEFLEKLSKIRDGFVDKIGDQMELDDIDIKEEKQSEAGSSIPSTQSSRNKRLLQMVDSIV